MVKIVGKTLLALFLFLLLWQGTDPPTPLACAQLFSRDSRDPDFSRYSLGGPLFDDLGSFPTRYMPFSANFSCYEHSLERRHYVLYNVERDDWLSFLCGSRERGSACFHMPGTLIISSTALYVFLLQLAVFVTVPADRRHYYLDNKVAPNAIPTQVFM